MQVIRFGGAQVSTLPGGRGDGGAGPGLHAHAGKWLGNLADLHRQCADDHSGKSCGPADVLRVVGNTGEPGP